MDRHMQECKHSSHLNDNTIEPVATFTDDYTHLHPERGHPEGMPPRRRRRTASKTSRASSQCSACRTTYERFLEVPSSKHSIFIKQHQHKRFAIIVSIATLLFLGTILWVLYCR